MDEIALLRGFRGGDAHATTELLDRYFAVIYRFCAHRGAAAVEEVAVQTFVACQSAQVVPPRDGLRAYLLQLAGAQLERRAHARIAAGAPSATAAALDTPLRAEPLEPESGIARKAAPEHDVFFDIAEHVARGRAEAVLLHGSGRPARLGRFELIRSLGRGGMGMVFEAIDGETGERVAIKTVARRDSASLFWLKREFRTLRELLHPNLITFHELFAEDAVWFFSMQLIRGVDFISHVRPGDRLELARLTRALPQLIDGIEAIHAAGMVHNDLKPGNVLVEPGGRVVILDFGLAAELAALGVRDHVAGGTPGYMAPEQAAGAAPAPAADLYALGMLLHRALTGTLAPALGDVSPDARAFPPDVPRELRVLCAQLLQRDPAARPDCTEVRARLRAPAAPAWAHAAARMPPAVFVGREAELAVLARAYAQACAGRPAAVLLAGASGIGKSRLIERFASAHAATALVFAGRCSEHEQVPFKAFDGVIDALCQHLARLSRDELLRMQPDDAHLLIRVFPMLAQVFEVALERGARGELDMIALRSRAFAGLKQLLRRLAEQRPLIVVVDDLQWADLDSARLLAELLAPPSAPALLLIGAYRKEDEAESAFLAELGQRVGNIPGAPRLERVELPRLRADETAELAARLLGEQAARTTAEAVARESDGTPLFVAELVRHLQAVEDAAESGAAQGALAPAVSIEQAIFGRVQRLPDAAQRLLEALCVADGPTSFAVARSAAGVEAGGAGVLQRLERECLIRLQRRGAFAPYHDRVRELIVARLGADAQRGYHARLARALEQHPGAEPERLAHHYAAAGEHAPAAGYAVVAAEQAFEQLAFHRAGELFGTALRLLPGDDARLSGLERRRADALALAGHGALAAAGYERAAAAAPEQAHALLRLAAAQWLRAGRNREGVARVEQLLREVGVSWPRSTAAALASVVLLKLRLLLRGLEHTPRAAADPAAARARLETIAAVCGEVAMVDTLRGALLQTRLLLLALEQDDAVYVAQGLAWEAMNSAWLGGPGQDRRAQRLVARAQTLAAGLDAPLASGIASLAEAGCHLFAGRHERVRQPALAAEALLRERCPGAWWERQLVVSMRYSTLERTGELLELAAEAPARLQDAYEKDDRFSKGQLALFAPLVHMMHDDPAAALRMLDEQRAHAQGDFDTVQLWILYRTVDANMYAGHVDAALEYLAREFERLARSALYRTKFVRLGVHFLRGKCSIGAAARYPQQLEVALRDARTLERMHRTDADCYARVLRAGIAARRGELGRAADECRQAVRACSAAHIGHYAMLAARNLGKVSKDSHERTRAAEAEQRLRAQGIADPERWAATFAPGFEALSALRS